jgi:hypothetical protein
LEAYIYDWLEAALDVGIKEAEFWSMTLAELVRAVESAKRREKAEQQKRALYDYRLADLVGRSVARIYSKGATLPELHDAYPTLFDDGALEEAKAEREAERFAAQLMAFSAAHNKRLEEVGTDGEQQATGSD